MTRLHHRWGAPEAEIFVFKFLPWPGFEPRTSQSNGRERNHSTTATPMKGGGLRVQIQSNPNDLLLLKIQTLGKQDQIKCSPEIPTPNFSLDTLQTSDRSISICQFAKMSSSPPTGNFWDRPCISGPR